MEPPAPPAPAAADADAAHVLYFAIGSMTNPTSLAMRGLKPLRSWPAEVLDFELRFDLGRVGMADALAKPGSSFHGVLHEMEASQMATLDGIESGYKRVPARVRRYDGELLDACVYSAPRAADGTTLGLGGAPHVESLPPSQRYVELIAAGCRHYGVADSYCDALLARECTPRTAPADFLSHPVPADVETWDEARLAAAPESETVVVVALNGKVLRLEGGMVKLMRNLKLHGRHAEPVFARMLYDVKYGAPERLELFTREHAAYLEDNLQRSFSSSPGFKSEVVGLLSQVYCGEAAAAGAGSGAAAV